ncbi:4-amino-4-deoxy-L-arabinose transferase-like glycosyltransferase [Nakamurella sp. UYEF19]|uniref:ArnT family glycosyltransferase n=1 Tax=Nakamurella sp. UYEF19 TaxID=1756392 RepID=UPI003397D344
MSHTESFKTQPPRGPEMISRPSHTRSSSGTLLALGALTTALLAAFSSRYGYHRDELYFLASGQHPAWGYPDQPPLTPLLARAISWIAPDSLTVLRLPSAIIAGIVVVLTGLIARTIGAGRAGQLLAACCMGAAGGTLAITHTLGTSALDLLCWTVLGYLVVRILAGADSRWWLVVGVVLGVALENKWLVGFFAVAVLAGLAIAGPRESLRSRWLWVGALIAVLLWLPNLLWQAQHGWPQLALSRSIADGGSTSSEPWYLFVPLELVFMSPLLVPVWAAGLGRLFGAGLGLPRRREFSAFGWAYVLLAVVFVVTGGKPYYLVGFYPVLFAAGAEPTVAWLQRGRTAARRVAITAAVVLSLLVDAVISLPLLPVDTLSDSPVMALNADAGETVGWPQFVDTVAAAYRAAPAGSVLLMGNYGEAGAVDHFGPADHLPHAYSGHNAYGLWGPPGDRDATGGAAGSAVAVGIDPDRLRQWFATVQPVATIDNGVGLDNEEQDEVVWLCTGQLLPWSRLWPQVQRLG